MHEVPVGGRDRERLAERLAALGHAHRRVQVARDHEGDARVRARRAVVEDAAPGLAPRDAGSGDERLGRGLGEPGDEVDGVELRGIDEHRHGGAAPLVAPGAAHLPTEPRPRGAHKVGSEMSPAKSGEGGPRPPRPSSTARTAIA